MSKEFIPVTKKLLTRPVIKWVVDKTRYFKIENAMHIGKTIKPRKGDDPDKQKEPATVCNVIDLENGALAQLIVNAVLKSVLTEEYPNDAYVGKCFAVTKQSRQPGKQYDPFNIEEIEDPNAGDSGDSTSSASPLAAHAGKRR
jgi:hypothetical protein